MFNQNVSTGQQAGPSSQSQPAGLRFPSLLSRQPSGTPTSDLSVQQASLQSLPSPRNSSHLPYQSTPQTVLSIVPPGVSPSYTLSPSSMALASPQMNSNSKSISDQADPSKAKSSPEELSQTEKPTKKRKKKGSEADGDEKKKTRPKTGRACDACRSRKIRCDIQTDQSPANKFGQTVCAHCRANDLECTFFLPITETRFKKKTIQPDINPDFRHSPAMVQRRISSSHSPNYENMTGERERDGPGIGRIEGPTSISFLLHTSLPAIQSEAYDLRHHNSWEVLEDGNGFIRVNAPPTATGYADADPQDPTKAHNRLNKPVLSAQTMSLLVNAYFNEVAPILPIISRTEFASKSNPSPLMLYSICGLGATRRQFPKELFTGVRGVINGILRSNDILSDARIENVQALLLLAQVGDLHAQPSAPTASASLIRTGAAIRMAQDLGLHRELSHRTESTQDLMFIELRRRIWSACVIMDRWYGAALGIPLTVDILDCDVLLPASYDIIPDVEPSKWPIEISYMGLTEHLKLSILMGRVLKTVYSPTGLKNTTDIILGQLVSDLDLWFENIPESLKFKGNSSSSVEGLLFMAFAAVQFLFWRVFMRLDYQCPPHLTFTLDISKWTQLVTWSRQALEWLDTNDSVLDTVFIYPYAATSCALVQYHTWARRGDLEALDTLKKVKGTATRWERIAQPDQMSIRRKTCETMTLLYEAALKTNPAGNDKPRPSGNPTAGVQLRKEPARLIFVKDPSRPGGGFYVADSEKEKSTSGLGEGDIVLASELTPRSQQGLTPNEKESSQSTNVQPFVSPSLPQGAQNMGTQTQAQSVQQPFIQAHTDDLGHIIGVDEGVLQNMQNVNPQLDSGELGQAMDFGYQMTHATGDTTSVLDPSFLDSLPLSTFDWDSWSTYFDKFLPSASNSFETMQ
ncbi:hypothetical protein J008_00838 [Cryptococcus neoformans]|nr:hypothetical protein C362_05048 [Cryptococcus neoformans var. grubii Bt1]OXH41274.1 hypothetical protein J008_00838 [Cryptococcus neoformans var. grubii]